jgi:hypothetical protein
MLLYSLGHTIFSNKRGKYENFGKTSGSPTLVARSDATGVGEHLVLSKFSLFDSRVSKDRMALRIRLHLAVLPCSKEGSTERDDHLVRIREVRITPNEV